MSEQVRHRRFISWDGLGASLSTACAIHCAALPLVFGLLPSVQMALRSADHEWHGLAQWLLWTHDVERIVVTLVVSFAALVLVAGYLRHRRRGALIVALAAAVSMIAGAFGHWSSDNLIHIAMQVAGGLGIAAAHLLNLRSLHAWDPSHQKHAHGWRIATTQAP